MINQKLYASLTICHNFLFFLDSKLLINNGDDGNDNIMDIKLSQFP